MNTYKAGNDFVDNLIEESGLSSKKGWCPDNVKKVINGTAYNTATSTCLVTWNTPKNIDFSDHFSGSETLYQTKAGKLFLVVQSDAGGAPGGFRFWENGQAQRGYVLVPLTIDQAVRWVGYRDLADYPGITEALGIEDEEDELPESLVLRLSPTLMRIVTDQAKKEGVSRQHWIAKCLEDKAKLDAAEREWCVANKIVNTLNDALNHTVKIGGGSVWITPTNNDKE